MILLRFPDGLAGPSKPQNYPLRPRNGPHFGPFCVQKGQIWGQKSRFSQICIFIKKIWKKGMAFLAQKDLEKRPK